ncbi:thioesterase II family protein [Streptomyces sp. NPDC002018]|uniref:thioesterase II family protein n=1 Tax=Streptomyces sp. NPDC002018 TaxID=3364629 RepID=UPI0036A01E96
MDSQWFRRFGEARFHDTRLICFPHAGGSAGVFAPLSRRLSSRLDVLAVQYPGRQDRRRETPADDIVRLAERIAEGLRGADDRPYALFGHSMGALVAYETARALERWGAPLPIRLFLSGRGAPGPYPNPHDLLADDQAILAAVRSLGGTGAAVLDDPELVEMALPALRADYRALASYRWRPGGPLDIPVTALTGRDDTVVPVTESARWEEFTRAGCELKVFPGGHFYLDRHLDAVAELLVSGAQDPVTQGGR